MHFLEDVKLPKKRGRKAKPQAKEVTKTSSSWHKYQKGCKKKKKFLLKSKVFFCLLLRRNHRIGELELVDWNLSGSFDLEHSVCSHFSFLGGGEGCRFVWERLVLLHTSYYWMIIACWEWQCCWFLYFQFKFFKKTGIMAKGFNIMKHLLVSIL